MDSNIDECKTGIFFSITAANPLGRLGRLSSMLSTWMETQEKAGELWCQLYLNPCIFVSAGETISMVSVKGHTTHIHKGREKTPCQYYEQGAKVEEFINDLAGQIQVILHCDSVEVFFDDRVWTVDGNKNSKS